MTREEKEQWDIFMKIWVIPALKNTWNEKKCKEIVEALEEWEEQEPCKNAIGREDMLDAIGHGTTYTSEELQRIIKGLPPVNPQKCDRCEVGNPCLYCKHEFEPQESERV